MVTIESIIEKASAYLPELNRDRVRHAYEFAAKAHEGQTRFSGEPYIIHPLSVADILLDYHPDEDSIVTALLHDVAEDTKYTLEDIKHAFGPQVQTLCDSLVKLSKVRSRLNDPQTENLRKLFLAMAADIRVVMLKLCDRLHNMSTLEFVRPEKRIRIAQETLNVYAPIAARMGIYRLKTQLEDLCFMYLQPEEYNNILAQLEKTGKWREKYIDMARKILIETLAKEGMQAEVEGRVKGIYSIYRKMKKKNRTSIDEVFDVFAMRIILPDIYKYGKEYTGHLYTALGVLHNNFTPLAHRFKDYVAVPKVNGYRSLHTTVVGLGPKTYTQPTEVQIRSMAMHQAGEFGVAAHWIYEDDDSEGVESHTKWLSGLKQIQDEVSNNQELIENLKVDVFQDRIFVLTPRGDVKDLPAGATPIDFAYAVHTEVGDHYAGARVNGTIATADASLRNGDVVDIITRKSSHPSQAWLSFVKTTHARNRIRGWFRNTDSGKNLREGRELLNAKLAQVGKPPLDMTMSVLKNYEGGTLNRQDREQIVIEVGRGGLLPSAVIKKIFSVEDLLSSGGAQQKERKPEKEETKPVTSDVKPTFVIGGVENMPHNFVKCCNASEGGDLVGYVTRGRGVSIHRKECPVVRNTEDSRLIPVYSGAIKNGKPSYAVHVVVEAADRFALVRDITQVLVQNAINILDFFQDPPKEGNARINFILDITDFDQLEKVLSALEKIPSVRRACKVN